MTIQSMTIKGAGGASCQPRDRFFVANRLRLHLIEWGDTGPVVLLLHSPIEAKEVSQSEVNQLDRA